MEVLENLPRFEGKKNDHLFSTTFGDTYCEKIRFTWSRLRPSYRKLRALADA